MSFRQIILSIITALIITVLHQFIAAGKYSYPEYNVAVGQVADFELVAPFDFPVLKSEKEMQLERSRVLENQPTPYSVSDQAVFDTYAQVDDFFAEFEQSTANDPNAARTAAQKATELDLAPELLAALSDPDLRHRLYEKFRKAIGDTYAVPVYENIKADSVMVYSGDEVRGRRKTEFQSLKAARESIVRQVDLPGQSELVARMAEKFLQPSLLVNEDKLKELTEMRMSDIPSVAGDVLKNEVIITRNKRITETDIEKLNSLTQAYRQRDIRKSPWQQMSLNLGMLLLSMVLVLIATQYLLIVLKRDNLNDVSAGWVQTGFLVLVLLAWANNVLLGYSNLLIPFALTVISAAVLISFDFAVVYGVCSMLLVAPFVNWEPYTLASYTISTLMALILLRRQNTWHEYFRTGLILIGTSLVVSLMMALYKNDVPATALRNAAYASVSALISAMGIAIVVVYLERKWNRATKQTLLELLDFNHPLLKKLATQAVGTYHHSLVVGNLAERAAEAIGANPLLARVGSYYHDIGKVVNTEIFTENNEDSAQIHGQLKPDESARMIRNHVQEGIILANKYHIPQPVIDIIMQHHGSSSIRFFLDQASKTGEITDPESFRYPGPKPISKEAALVMLADVVESTTKSKNVSTEEEIAKIIEDTIQRLISEGQFDDAPISIRDLNRVKQSMLPVLESIYRKRLDYPEEPALGGTDHGTGQ